MVSFIDFYFNFVANFQTQTSPHMFSQEPMVLYIYSCYETQYSRM